MKIKFNERIQLMIKVLCLKDGYRDIYDLISYFMETYPKEFNMKKGISYTIEERQQTLNQEYGCDYFTVILIRLIERAYKKSVTKQL